MLHFLRKYQTYFFAVIAFFTIVSFSFFGTYNTLPADSIHEQVAFTAIDGKAVKRSSVEELAHFISSDKDDKLLFGGSWNFNFLNDGVVKKDFLETGLAEVLVEAYPEELEKDLHTRAAKERHFNLYTHPQGPFISVETVWSYFAPQMKTFFERLKLASRGTDPEAFSSRVGLFLGERRLPAPLLQRVLTYQQRQYPWITPDPNLNQMDLSLFGYHTLEDWFGPRFLRLVAATIINGSKIAEQKGYRVSKEEAWADLSKNAELSFQENLQNPQLGVANSSEYLSEQLHRLGMDRNKAISVWQQVLLFRRLMLDMGNSVLTDPLAVDQFLAYSNETAEGDLYHLPEAFHLTNYRDLQKFETYLDAIASRDQSLDIPEEFFLSDSSNINKTKSRFPELIQKRYSVKLAQVKKEDLQTKVSIKEMWDWEGNEQNWKMLTKHFPDLGMKQGSNRTQRMAALDSLDSKTRGKVDAFVRSAIVDNHPEWLQQALEKAESKTTVVSVRYAGGRSWIPGWKDDEKLMKLLDNALPGEENAALAQLTGDNNTYFRIIVLDKSPEEIMTYAEANQEGILDDLLDRQLEGHYVRIRGNHQELFKKDDGSWKTFEDVKNQVADIYFQPILEAVAQDYAKFTGKPMKVRTGDLVAPLRLYSYMRSVQDQLKQKPKQASLLVRQEGEYSQDMNPIKNRVSLSDQWKVLKTDFEGSRAGTDKVGTIEINPEELIALSPGEWTPVHTPVNGDLFFFHLERKEKGDDSVAISEKVSQLQALLSDDAQRAYLQRLIRQLKDKNALSLNYLNPVEDTSEADSEL